MRDEFYKNLPEEPGVYIMKDVRGRILYIGKAGSLKKRVASYFQSASRRTDESRIEKLVSEIKKIDYQTTDSVLEALILEAELIKKRQPPYNIKEKDDKSFLYIEITRDEFPRVFLVRGRALEDGEHYGPFVSASDLRQAMKILRKIFPWSIHPKERIGKLGRPCFDYQIGLCPGTCTGVVSKRNYTKNIGDLRLFLKGKKQLLLKKLEKEMKKASDKLDFEKANKAKNQIFALQHIQDTALISESVTKNQELRRIEGYDVSNISGTSAVGSMVVFVGGEPCTNEYRKFKIFAATKQDDTRMLKEVLRRRLGHEEWPLPDLILVDGGKGQVNAVETALVETGLKIPVIGIAKGSKRKNNRFVGRPPKWTDRKTLIGVRDEAHRFAIKYHRERRSKASGIKKR